MDVALTRKHILDMFAKFELEWANKWTSRYKADSPHETQSKFAALVEAYWMELSDLPLGAVRLGYGQAQSLDWPPRPRELRGFAKAQNPGQFLPELDYLNKQGMATPAQVFKHMTKIRQILKR